jgi:hypothetical protein
MDLLLNSTPVALWHRIIHDAETSCDINLNEELEAYLVFLLVRYTTKPEIIKQIMASEFLNSFKLSPKQRGQALQEVGDKCLLFSGLFPSLSEKRFVKIGYFVNLGQSAYAAVSSTHNDLYYSLAHQFVPLMDILQSVRLYSKKCLDLLPLQAYELWNETGSQRALNVLKQYTSCVPLKIIKD